MNSHNSKRPVNLNLSTISFPPMAIVSILHRISGFLLFLLMPVMLYFLQISLQDEQSYLLLHHLFTRPLYKLLLWGFLSALIYHLLAGMRHLLMDLGYGDSLAAGRRGANLVIFMASILIICIGIWLW